MSSLQYNIKNKISTIHFSMYLNLLKLFVYIVVDCSYVCNFVHNVFLFYVFLLFEKKNDDLYNRKI